MRRDEEEENGKPAASHETVQLKSTKRTDAYTDYNRLPASIKINLINIPSIDITDLIVCNTVLPN